MRLSATPPGRFQVPEATPEDDAIALSIRAELALRSELSPWLITAEVRSGVATLMGVASSLAAAEDAVLVASAIHGVRAIIDRLELMGADTSDEQVVREIHQALASDAALSDADIGVSVYDSRVSLSGTIGSHQQRVLAERIAKGVQGVRAVDSKDLYIDMGAPRPDEQIRLEAERRLATDVRLKNEVIDVDVEDGVVTLSGGVGSLEEKYLAYLNAWVRGTRNVLAEDLRVEWWRKDRMVRQDPLVPTDAQVKRALLDALAYDPRMFGPLPEVHVKKRVVFLTGAVPSITAKAAAEKDARNTVGVRDVHNLLVVRPIRPYDDAVLLRRVANALYRCPQLDAASLMVSVHNHRVYLSGTVSTVAELRAAEKAVGTVGGVVDVESAVLVAGGREDTRSDVAMQKAIERRLWSRREIDARRVRVDVTHGVVTLTGSVHDGETHETAIQIAQSAWPDRVVDLLTVEQPALDTDRVSETHVP